MASPAYKTPRGLGKGLDALLGGESNDLDSLRRPVGYIHKEASAPRPVQGAADVLRIPVEDIAPNPFQPRLSFDREALEELADSIRTLGLIQPVTVRRTTGGRYQIISGERRLRACKLAGLETIPAYVRDTDDQGMLEMAIVENVQREDLDPIETALGYQRLIEECNLTQEQMATRVGKKRASITNSLRLLRLPPKVQHDLKLGLISTGHAKVLLSLEDPELQTQLCESTVRSDLSVRQLEERVKALLNNPRHVSQDDGGYLPEEYYKVLEYLGRFFGDNISLKRNAAGKGSITLRFDSDEEMKQLLSALEDKLD